MLLVCLGIFVLTSLGPFVQTIVSGFEVTRSDTKFRYTISEIKQCSVSGIVFRKIVRVSLDDCVYNCLVRNECQVISYLRRYPMCELRSNVTQDDSATDKVKGCVTVKRTDMNIIEGEPSCASSEESCFPRDCPIINLKHGEIKGNMYSPSSKHAVFCDKEVPNVSQITCLSNGSWSHDHFCVDATDNVEADIDCNDPPKKQNSTVSDGGTTVNSTRKYTCIQNYTTGNEIVMMETICDHNGQWTATNFTCFKERRKTIGKHCDDSNSCVESNSVCIHGWKKYSGICFCKSNYKYNDEQMDCIQECENLQEGFKSVHFNREFWPFFEQETNVNDETQCTERCNAKTNCSSYGHIIDRCFLSQVTYDRLIEVFPNAALTSHGEMHSLRC